LLAQLPVQAVESYGEHGAYVGHTAIKAGKPPSAELFAIIDYDCTEQEYARQFCLERLTRGYFLKLADGTGTFPEKTLPLD